MEATKRDEFKELCETAARLTNELNVLNRDTAPKVGWAEFAESSMGYVKLEIDRLVLALSFHLRKHTIALGGRILVLKNDVLGTESVMATVTAHAEYGYVVCPDDAHDWEGPVDFDGNVLQG